MHRCHLILALARGLLYDAAANDPVLQVRPLFASPAFLRRGFVFTGDKQKRPPQRHLAVFIDGVVVNHANGLGVVLWCYHPSERCLTSMCLRRRY